MIERRENWVISARDLGPAGELRAEVLQKRLMDLSIDHSLALGCGWEAMRGEGCFWALARLKVVVFRHPIIGENLSLLTWPSPAIPSGIWRSYHLETVAGERIAQAMGLWAIIDIPTGKPRRCDHFPLWNSSLPYRQEPIWSEGIGPWPGSITVEAKSCIRTVEASDIDANGHVNNLRYIAYTQDALKVFGDPWEGYRSYRIYYLSPLFAGDTLTLSLIPSDTKKEVRGVTERSPAKLTAFRCLIE